ncbi:retrovirus-related Pol polyprotein from transposon 412 [Nephila pilipes]|uniref:Retrovirus-related Pol polyprotein from transposon 412 n=1 Tax=Nephila pilipes TaxID=299642 RepID=A0A8X6MHA2_NEPPI|nr:retrovirus-related Pol polyprotein from transposon 412 [Nephila pilipes]
MIIDTGAKVTIIRTDLAYKLGKVYLNIAFGHAKYHHMAYVANINDQFILGLDFLKENNFKLDFKNSEPHSCSEDIEVFKTENSDIKPVHHITAKRETTLPSRTETIV